MKTKHILIGLGILAAAGLTVIIIRRKSNEEKSNVNGGYDMWQKAIDLSFGLAEDELKNAIKIAGGIESYITGRETAIKRIQSATNELNDVMNINGVHGLGTIMDSHIEINVNDNSVKQQVIDFLSKKNKSNPVFSSRPIPFLHYAGYPVKIVIRPMSVAQSEFSGKSNIVTTPNEAFQQGVVSHWERMAKQRYGYDGSCLEVSNADSLDEDIDDSKICKCSM